LSDRREYDTDIFRTGENKLWCEWFRQHGLDPGNASIAVPGWVERREDECQIAYEAYVTDREGGVMLGMAFREVQVFQLEALPRPFPLP
jgi:hypothetical protein